MAELANYVIALATVALLLTATLYGLRWWMAQGGKAGLFKDRAPKRLAIVDQIAVDARRRLLLIRRDDMEHLIMIGGPSDIVIETAITSEAARPANPADTSKIAERAAAHSTLGNWKRTAQP